MKAPFGHVHHVACSLSNIKKGSFINIAKNKNHYCEDKVNTGSLTPVI